MKTVFQKVIAILLLASMVLGLASCVNSGAGTGSDGPTILEPEAKKEVTSVAIKYNNKTENDGYINVDLSAGSIDLTATVRVKNKCEYTLTFESSNTSVAEITNEGKVTLKSVGETVITAKAGGLSHSVVLIVSSSAAGQYGISVQGGEASVESAKEGDEVTLTVNADKTQLFKGWRFFDAETGEPIENVWINSNTFRMPAQSVIIKADFDVKTYALKVVDATLKSVSNEDTEVRVGSVVDGVATYYVPVGARVTLERQESPEGKIFVGWDTVYQGNRYDGDIENEYVFEMPDEDLSVFAVFSETKDLTFDSYGIGGTTSLTQTKITDGVLSGEGSADADLQGLDGYRFSFSAASSGSKTSFTQNFRTPNRFTTLGDGSQTVKVIYKNNSNYDLDLEFYASQYGTVLGTGVVSVPANSTKEAFLVADHGFHNPYFGLMLRNTVGGSSSETIDLDMVWTLADTYPYGDNSFDVLEAKYVKLWSDSSYADYPADSGIRNSVYYTGPIAGEFGGANATKGSLGGRKNVNNENGMTYIHSQDSYSDDTGGTRYIYAKIDNLPEYDPEDPTVTVYFRFINTNDCAYTLSFGLGKSTDINNDESRVSYELNVEPYGTKVFGITIDRDSADEDIYFSIQILSNKSSNYYNFAVQMMYNNRIGTKPEDIAVKQSQAND